MRAVNGTPRLGWLSERVGVEFTPAACGIAAETNDGRLVGMVGLDLWTANGCQMHVAVEAPTAWLVLVRSVFQYVFGELGRRQVVGWVLSTNAACLRAAKGVGFAEVARIPDGWADGVDLVGLQMRKETCRWFKPVERKAA